MSLEHELKRALRAQDPGDAFTARVLARVKAGAGADAQDVERGASSTARMVKFPPTEARTRPRTTASPPTGSRRLWSAVLAATLLLTAAGGTQWVKHRQEMAEGERARADVLAALRLTSSKLSIVRAAVADSETAH